LSLLPWGTIIADVISKCSPIVNEDWGTFFKYILRGYFLLYEKLVCFVMANQEQQAMEECNF
jgi:hypothetical protein